MKILVLAPKTNHTIDLLAALRRLNAEILTTDSCKLGLKQLSMDPTIDLVIIQLHEGDDCGELLLRTVKKEGNAVPLPVIIAGHGFNEDSIREFLALDVDDIMILPVAFETLEAKVRGAIRHSRKTVLVVDDDETIRDVLAQFLTLQRYRVLTSASGEEALDILKSEHVSAVVTDLVMPGMSGVELLNEIKTLYPDTPVLMITGNSGKYRPEKIIALGADGYFLKPFHYAELAYTLTRVLSGYRGAARRDQRPAAQSIR